MDTVLLIVGAVGGLFLGLVAGLWVGGLIKNRPAWVYWLLNVLASILCVVLGSLALIAEQRWLFIGAIGLMGGTLTGLKYGFGRSVGVWAIHDRLMKNDGDLPN